MDIRIDERLTDRQREVLERIDKRVPIKVIARDLGLSEARINQHIRALKDKFGVDSMGDLVEHFRARKDYQNSVNKENSKKPIEAKATENTPYRNSQYRKSELPDEPIFPDEQSRGNPGEIAFSDAHHVLIDAPWTKAFEPAVVPAELDGNNAILYRLAVMVGIAFGIIAMVVLVITASLSLSAVMEENAEVRIDQNGRAD